MIAYPLQSNFMGFDDADMPIFDRAVDSNFYHAMQKLFYKTGVFLNPSTMFQVVEGAGMTVLVNPGAAFIEGVTVLEDQQTQLVLETPSSTSDRTDRVVLRLDHFNRNVSLEVKKGTTELTRNSNIYEIGLADVAVKKLATGITQANITDLRLNTGVCGVVSGTINQADTTTIFNQYNAFLQEQIAAWNAEKTNQTNAWQTQTNAQADAWNTWFGGAQTDIAKAAQFNFDNLAGLPENTRATVFNGDGSITETIKKTSGGLLIANRQTTFNANGTISTMETLYQADGVSVYKRNAVTTTFLANGNIEEKIEVV